MSGLVRGSVAATTSAAFRSAPCACSRSSTLSRLRPTSSSLRQTRLRSTQAQRPAHDAPNPQRALLYVPGSSQKMLDKMLAPPTSAAAAGSTVPDVVTLDLEDSVRTEKKAQARRMVTHALQTAPKTSRTRRFVRINPGQQGLDDLEAILTTDGVDGLLLPKVNSAEDVLAVSRFIDQHGSQAVKGEDDRLLVVVGPCSIHDVRAAIEYAKLLKPYADQCSEDLLIVMRVYFEKEHKQHLRMIASIESPLGLLNMRQIVTASDKVGGLLFAAEDYCASSRIIRTPSRYEMLYARSSVVAVAHAYHLAAIDLVCVKYKGEEAEAILREESEEGRRLGFTGKQAIHPAQVPIIQRAFAPSDAEISRAQAILEQYEAAARTSGAGAYGLKGSDGQTEMIDAPMLLQAQGILASARAAGLV